MPFMPRQWEFMVAYYILIRSGRILTMNSSSGHPSTIREIAAQIPRQPTSWPLAVVVRDHSSLQLPKSSNDLTKSIPRPQATRRSFEESKGKYFRNPALEGCSGTNQK